MGDEPRAEAAIEHQPPSIEHQPQDLSTAPPARMPQFRRDVFPKNLTLSAEDLREFCELLSEANERAKRIELANVIIADFENEAQARERINEFMPIEYNHTASNGDNVQGLGIPDVEDRAFPSDIKSFFVSNSSFANRAIKNRPLNCVDAFIDFQIPSLKIDLNALPSNPTENNTVINIYGRDEDWVISTTDRLKVFFKSRENFRPVIHGPGTYDYFIYLLFLPAVIWFYTRNGTSADVWLERQSTFFNVVFGVYALLLSLLLARFLFQYVRWLFPPMEYYKKHRIGASIHRAAAGFVGLAVLGGAAYDIGKAILEAVFG